MFWILSFKNYELKMAIYEKIVSSKAVCKFYLPIHLPFKHHINTLNINNWKIKGKL